MYRMLIYIIDHMNFWPPIPRLAPKKIGIKCAFLLTQTVILYFSIAALHLINFSDI